MSCPASEKSANFNDEDNFLEVLEKGMEDLFDSGMTQILLSGMERGKNQSLSHQLASKERRLVSPVKNQGKA